MGRFVWGAETVCAGNGWEGRVGFIHLHLMLMQNIGPRKLEMNECNVDVNVAII